MTYEYRYVRRSDLPGWEALGWEYVGPMRPGNWASPNHDSIIVRRRVR